MLTAYRKVHLKADKGGALVVMTREQYIEKVEKHISDAKYTSLPADPTEKVVRKINRIAKPILKHCTIPNQYKTYALLNNDRTPVMYGLPKVHKDGVPIRPIVSSISAPFDGIAWILDRILQPLLKLILTITLSTKDFTQYITKISIDWTSKEYYFLSAEIDSLYTSVPVDQVINNILNLISEHDIETFSLTQDDIRHLLLLALQDNYFKFNDVYYMQGNCLAMGNRLAVVASNSFVYELERKLFADLPNQPLL